MGMLYAGKTSSVLVAFFFLPFYNRLLGSEQFGVVAVILSLQALLTMMDLGMSTLVSREVAVTSSTGESLFQLIRTAELSLSAFYVILLAGALLENYVNMHSGIGWSVVCGTILLFWILVLQNLYYTTMIARRDYTLASTIQVIGVAIRACATSYVLFFISATLEAFVFTQLASAIIHWQVSRLFCKKSIFEKLINSPEIKWPKISDAIGLAKSGGALILFSAAGAAVMQLDKPLISAFVSAASVAPYYLASLLCITPISMLAGPISQYFQPILLREAAQGCSVKIQLVLKRFVVTIFLITGLPSCVLWLYRTPIIDFWTGHTGSTDLISRYVEILLPGLAIGALGFIPYSLLMFAKDFRFQALLSTCMTLITLSLVAFFANEKNIEAICLVYSAYHSLSTIASWVRAMMLPGIKSYALYSAVLALILVLAFVSILWLANFLLFL